MTTREFIEKELAEIEAADATEDFRECGEKLTGLLKALGLVIFTDEHKACEIIAGSFVAAAKTAFGRVLEHLENEAPQ